MSTPTEHNYLRISAYLLFGLGLIFLVLNFITTPAFVGTYFTLDGSIDENRLPTLLNLRRIALLVAILCMATSAASFVLSLNRKNAITQRLNFRLQKLSNFDLAECIQQYWRQIPTHSKKLFGINLLTVLLCHGFLLFNLIINWDGQGGLYFPSEAFLGSGRWFASLLSLLNESVFQPIPMMGISFVLLAISATLLSETLGLKGTVESALVSALLISFPSYAIGFSYNFVAYYYPASTLLTILSIRQALKQEWKSTALAILFFILMLGIYQSMLAFGYSLMLILVVLQLVHGKKPLSTLVHFVVVALVAPLAYKLASDLIMTILNLEYYDYRGANKISISYILTNAPKNLTLCYRSVLSFFSGLYFTIASYQIISLIALLAIGLITIIKSLQTNSNKWFNYALLLLLALIAPIIIFSVQFLNTNMDSLMVFGMAPVFCGLTALIFLKGGKLSKSISILLTMVVLLGFVNRSNNIHLKNYLWTQTSLHMASDIAIKIAALPEFEPSMKLVRIGNLSPKKFPLNPRPPFDETGLTMTGPTGLTTWGESMTLNGMMNFLGFKYQFIDSAHLPSQIHEEIESMPIYPEEGSIIIIRHYVIIHLENQN